MKGLTAGFALCGSFCTIKQATEEIKKLKETGYNIIPIMSPIVYSTDNRFNKAQDLKKENYDVKDVTWNVFIKSIDDAKAVLNDTNATQADVDKALEDLKANIKNLGKAYDDFDPSEKPDNDTNKDTEADDETEATENEETNNVTENNTETQAPAQTQAPATESKRCGSAVATTSVIVTIVAALGSAVVIKKKD